MQGHGINLSDIDIGVASSPLAPPLPQVLAPPAAASGEDFELCEFTILYDRQEGAPWRFSDVRVAAKGKHGGDKRLIVPTRKVHLKTGDYTIEGRETEIAIERKSHADCWQTLCWHRERFERELERMQAMSYAAVVVEADWTELLTPPVGSRGNPKAIFQTILAYSERFPKTHWSLMPGRQAAEYTCFWLLHRWWRDGKEGKRNANTNA